MPQRERESRWSGPNAWLATAGVVSVVGLGVAGCQPAQYRDEADEVAYGIIERGQQEAIGRTEPFTIETPAETLRRRLIGVQALPIVGPESLGSDQLPLIEHWPEEDYPARLTGVEPVIPPWDPQQAPQLSLIEALQVGARNSREYQSRKEAIYRAALDLDLAADEFRTTYFGIIEGLITSDQRE
ncbi:MAG: hypothetical protein WD079_05925, partial [Phycisphaeraceae bacterium]